MAVRHQILKPQSLWSSEQQRPNTSQGCGHDGCVGESDGWVHNYQKASRPGPTFRRRSADWSIRQALAGWTKGRERLGGGYCWGVLNDPRGSVPIHPCVCVAHANVDDRHEGLCMAKSDADWAARECGNAMHTHLFYVCLHTCLSERGQLCMLSENYWSLNLCTQVVKHALKPWIESWVLLC